MKNSLVIIGAGGHGRVCAEIAELNGYKKILFLDDGNVGNIELAEDENSTSAIRVFLHKYIIAIATKGKDNSTCNRFTE